VKLLWECDSGHRWSEEIVSREAGSHRMATIRQ